ncbi:MAG: HD domain-containing phosphohydrolase [Armatimonadia bacterium]
MRTGEDQVSSALAALVGTLGLYWAQYGADGTRMAALLPPSAVTCATMPDCPLLIAGAHCRGAHHFPLGGGQYAGGQLVACQGGPHKPPDENVVKALAEALQATAEAEQEMSATVRELAATYQELSVAYGVLETISLPSSRESVAQTLLAHVSGTMGASGACVLSVDGASQAVPLAVENMPADEIDLVWERLQARAVDELRPDLPFSFEMEGKHVLVSGLNRDQCWCGLLAISRALDAPFSSREAKLLQATGRQAALAIRNRMLVEDLRNLFMSSIEALVAAIEAKDPYTCGHSRRVAGAARATALALGLSRQEADDIYTAAVVHDVGKIAVDTAILRKDGRLSEAEWQEVRVHPDRGAAIISCIPQLRHIVSAVRHHHERFDGHGYPFGLHHSQIPLDALIIAVCDAYDAMTSQRPYRDALPAEAARNELSRCTGTQFSQVVVEAFLATMAA